MIPFLFCLSNMSKPSMNDLFKSYFDDVPLPEPSKIDMEVTDKFWCPKCSAIIKYRKVSEHHIGCENCKDLKVYKKIYFGKLPTIIVGKSLHFKHNKGDCVCCGMQAYYDSVTFLTDILGWTLECIDMGRETCNKCHETFCHMPNHKVCRDNIARL